MGSSGQNSVQAGAFWGGYFFGKYLLLEKNIPDLDFLGLSTFFGPKNVTSLTGGIN